jgi:hypothetical protein
LLSATLNPTDLALFESKASSSAATSPTTKPDQQPVEASFESGGNAQDPFSSPPPRVSQPTTPIYATQPKDIFDPATLGSIPHLLAPQDLEAHISAAAMTILVRADLIEARLKNEEEEMLRQQHQQQKSRNSIAGEHRTSAEFRKTFADPSGSTSSKSPSSSMNFRWPPYPTRDGLLMRRESVTSVGSGNGADDDVGSPGEIGYFTPPPLGIKVPQDPRKEYGMQTRSVYLNSA